MQPDIALNLGQRRASKSQVHDHIAAFAMLVETAVFSLNLVRVLPWGTGIFSLLESIPGDRLLLSLASVGLFLWLTLLYLAATRPRADVRGKL